MAISYWPLAASKPSVLLIINLIPSMLGKLYTEPDYDEEYFGILSDDDLYLDCILVKPRNLQDQHLKALRVWVPRYPLTKTSVIACARQEVQSYGADGQIAHLVFDLRGTGESEGSGEDFDIDLNSIKEWATERFGTNVNFGFLGAPTLSRHGRIHMLPLRPSVVMETYYYRGRSNPQATLLYLATYGNFDKLDDARCTALAAQGYHVYGLDPLRYLLHASTAAPLTPTQLETDLNLILNLIEAQPYLIGLPISAGLALLWAALCPQIQGVMAIGRTQPAFQASHIFQNDQSHTYLLSRYISRIAPRPLTLIWQDGHPLGGDKQEMSQLIQAAAEPRRAERTTDISPQFLLNALTWQQNQN